jgi:hypothetical protein
MEDLTSLRLAQSTGAASFMVEFFEVIVRVFGTQPNVLSGPLAQLVEQLTLNQRVAGSSPARLTTFSPQNMQIQSVHETIVTND